MDEEGCGLIFGLALVLGAVALYIWLVVMFFRVVGPYMIIGIAGISVCYVAWNYQRLMYEAIVERPRSRPTPRRAHPSLASNPPTVSTSSARRRPTSSMS
jgi:hypothetical protein